MVNTAKLGSKVSIREMSDDDLDVILELDRKIVGEERAVTYRDPIDFYLGGEYAMSFVAEVDGNIVGFVLGRLRDPNTGWLQAVAIDPAYRRLGIGNKLVRALVDRSHSKGAKTLNTLVSLRDQSLLSFMRSLEFSQGQMVDLQRRL